MKSLLALISLLLPFALSAHHSTALNYSQERITLEGTVTELKWINPHASFVLVVENEDGTTDEWLVELLAKIALERQGFNFDQLQEGMQLTLTGRIGYREGTLRFGEGVTEDGDVILERNPVTNRFTQ